MRETFRATGRYGVSGRSALLCSVCSLSLVTATCAFGHRSNALPTDLRGTPVAGAFRADAPYTLLMVVTQKGARLAIDNEVEPFVTEKGEGTFTLTEAAMKTGDLKLEWQRARYDNAKLHEFLGHWIYQDQTLTDLAKPHCGRLRCVARGPRRGDPKDSARKRIRKHGRRLKGPELVTARAFNRRNRSDGIGFLQQQSFMQKVLRNKAWLRLPREIESSHILVVAIRAKARAH